MIPGLYIKLLTQTLSLADEFWYVVSSMLSIFFLILFYLNFNRLKLNSLFVAYLRMGDRKTPSWTGHLYYSLQMNVGEQVKSWHKHGARL